MPSGVKWMEIPSLFLLIGRNRCFFSWIVKKRVESVIS